MKKLTAAIAGFAALAGPAIALAAQPQWGSPYTSAKGHQPPAGPGTVNIFVGSKKSHKLTETYNGTAKRPCSSKYSWSVGHVKIGRSGHWSSTHPNNLPGAK